MKTLTVIGELLHPENTFEIYQAAIEQKEDNVLAYILLSTLEASRIGLSPSSSLKDLDRMTEKIIIEETARIEDSDAKCLYLEGKPMLNRFPRITKQIKWTNILIHAYYLRKIRQEIARNRTSGTTYTKYFDRWDRVITKNIGMCLQKHDSVLAIVGAGHLNRLEEAFSKSTIFNKIEVPSWELRQLKPILIDTFECFLKDDTLVK